jgi:hypothetical protein
MKPKQLAPFFLFFLFLTASIQAQNWAGVLAPSRAVNWSNAGVVGGIPSGSWTQCATAACNTVTSAGSSATAAQINAAIASAPANSYVLLAAGTYNLASGIDFGGHNNVVLRGAGADQTFLKFSGSVGCEGPPSAICMENGDNSWPGNPNQTATWTAGYASGNNSITLSSVTNLVPNQSLIILDQCDDGFTGTDCATGGPSDTGAVWNCNVAGTCTSVGGGPGGAARNNRSQQQQVLVTGISGKGPYTVTISPGLYMPNWRSSQNPGAFWANVTSTGQGVENLSIDATGVTGSPTMAAGIVVYNCYNCWVTGNRILLTERNHVWLYESSHVTVANNYMYGSQNATDLSYGVEHYMGSDNLIVNNIGEHIVSPYLQGGADEGVVWAHNFGIDDYYQTAPGWFMAGSWLHAAGSAMDLWEGNQQSGFTADNRHGTHHFTTLFRNYFQGTQAFCAGSPCGKQGAAIQLYANSRYFNVIGNVLGSPYQNNYGSIASNGINGNSSIYTVGWSGNGGSLDGTCCAADAVTPNSLMRWGNYDTVTATLRFANSEVPSNFNDGSGSPSAFVNPVPSSQNLPASFYSSSQPAFWTTPFGTPPWPANGPGVSGGNLPNVGGYANNIPAELCYANSPVDSSYQNSYPVTAASWSAGTATVTIGANGVVQGEVRITGVTPAGYNVPNGVQITGKSGNTISYPLASNPGSFSSGGTLTWPNIRLFNAASCYGSGGGNAPLAPTGLTAVVH